ncbi:alpha/beta fold hydrolase [Actinomadura alba]|uniref:Alpha/beta hydrolase n=1 Tax=Actinomadura alba TaxID=406431 RepID=A0ABR7LUV6_9ACTN|nr:alpha/beta hydrolase [Actinomadura alba]MBC6468540.1 alpha/beta hydrolase [Actinomadura alba]
MTEFLDIEGGRIAYDVTGEGSLVVLAPGLADVRGAFRFLAPKLVEAGHRVATVDLRGHGESSTGWSSHSRADTAGDLLALIRHLGGPAVIIGASFSGGSAVIAAAAEPALVSAIVMVDPGTRKAKLKPRDLTLRFVRGMTLIAGALLLRNTALWGRYLRLAYPGVRPADFDDYVRALKANLREPGRMAAAAAMGMSSAADAEARLPGVRCPALVVMGTLDPDFPDPRAEAEAIAAAMPAGVGTIAMIEGGGHYPHAQFPGQVADAALPFLEENAVA